MADLVTFTESWEPGLHRYEVRGKTTRYFLDTEFVPNNLDLLSIGVVASDGREYYAENDHANLFLANDWVTQNVIPQLWSQQADKRLANQWSRDHDNIGGLIHQERIATELRAFCDPAQYGSPVFWTDCGAFDFVILSQLFGDFTQWPAGWPFYFGDLQQWADQLLVKLPEQVSGQHHALDDARHLLTCWEFLAHHTRQMGLMIAGAV